VEKYGNVDYVTALLGFENSWQILTLLHRDSKSSPQPVDYYSRSRGGPFQSIDGSGTIWPPGFG
jgi:hypothetical protein